MRIEYLEKKELPLVKEPVRYTFGDLSIGDICEYCNSLVIKRSEFEARSEVNPDLETYNAIYLEDGSFTFIDSFEWVSYYNDAMYIDETKLQDYKDA